MLHILIALGYGLSFVVLNLIIGTYLQQGLIFQLAFTIPVSRS